MQKKRLAIFASGTGSNAMNLIRHFENDADFEVAFVLSNKENAPIVQSASEAGIKVLCYSNEEVSDGQLLTRLCQETQIDWIILAGYLRLIPRELIQAYPNRIINLHPSLLPKYGGKGMYGAKVHEAVLANGETETGITIHFVNEVFDDGEIIAQFKCPVNADESVESLQQKIHGLEHENLPSVVKETILKHG